MAESEVREMAHDTSFDNGTPAEQAADTVLRDDTHNAADQEQAADAEGEGEAESPDQTVVTVDPERPAKAQVNNWTPESSAVLKPGSTWLKRLVDSPSTPLSVLGFIVAVLCGLVFGMSLEKGKVFLPTVIFSQMLFRQFVMLKMFLCAATSSLITLAFMSGVMPERFENTRQYLINNSKGFISAIVGPLILGVGMTLAGSCPGNVIVQLGAGVTNAWIIVVGGLTASVVWGIVDKPLVQPMEGRCQPPLRRETVDSYLNKPYWICAMGLAAMCAAVVAVCEYYVPWKDDLPPGVRLDKHSNTPLHPLARAWPPEVAGVLVGVLQWPVRYFFSDGLGSATSYCTITAVPLKAIFGAGKLSERYTNCADQSTWWQVVYLWIGATLGAFLSSYYSGVFNLQDGFHPAFCFFGGFCMLFGSRIAGGCTSGHGISGMAELSLTSLVAVPMMFAGAIATAFILEGANAAPV